MDPNYRSFISWKKSSVGRGYMKEMDDQELERLKHQSIFKFPLNIIDEPQIKPNTSTDATSVNKFKNLKNEESTNNERNKIQDKELWTIDDLLNNDEIIENILSEEKIELKNETSKNKMTKINAPTNSNIENNLNNVNNLSKREIISTKVNGITNVKINFRLNNENNSKTELSNNDVISNDSKSRLMNNTNLKEGKYNSNLNLIHGNEHNSKPHPDNLKLNINNKNNDDDKIIQNGSNILNNLPKNTNYSNNPNSNLDNAPNNSNINYNNSANFHFNFKNNQPQQQQNPPNKRMSIQNQNSSMENSKQRNANYNNNNSSSTSFNKMYNAIQKNGKNNENNSISISNKKKRNMYFQVVSKESIAIECDFFLEPALMTIIKEHQGRFDRESRMWYAPYKNYIQIFQQIKECQALGDTNLFPITNLPLEVICKINYTLLKFQIEKQTHEIDYSKDRIHTIFELPSSMLTNLYNFQKIGIEFGIKKKGRMLLADEMGVGKTIQAIGISAVYREDWPVLILCPSSLKYNWRDEILNWLKDIVNEKEVQIMKTSKDELRKEMKFLICSYDLSIRIADLIVERNFKFVIADEAHYLKSKESKRSKMMVPILQKCRRLLLLSGTPILAKPVEIYPLLKALRPDIFSSFKAFGSRYCDPKNTAYGVDWSGSSNSKELHFVLSNIMLRRLKKDVLAELPPKKRQKVEIQTDKKIINQIRVLLNKTNKADLENESLMSKLIDDENADKPEDSLNCFTKAYALTGKAKIVGIQDYVNYLLVNKCKFLIFAHHLDVLDGIEEEVKKQEVKYIRIDGSISNEKRHIFVNTFQTDESCLVAILAITACATGLTLTKASTVVFSEIHFTPAIMIQAEDRAHRIGQENTCVNVHYLYGADTVDEILFPKLREKFFVVSSTLDDKRMDMDVQKTKSGCMGDFQAKGKKDDEENSTQIYQNEKVLFLNNSNKKNASMRNTHTLTEYFSVVNKKKDNVGSNIDSECDLDNKDTALSNIDEGIELNIHEGVVKRQRNMFDDSCNDYSLLENSFDDELISVSKKNPKYDKKPNDN